MKFRFGRHSVDTSGMTSVERSRAIDRVLAAGLETMEEDSKTFVRLQLRLLKTFERRYEMTTTEMLERWNRGDLSETHDLGIWNRVWHNLQLVQGETPTTGTPSATTLTYTKSA